MEKDRFPSSVIYRFEIILEGRSARVKTTSSLSQWGEISYAGWHFRRQDLYCLCFKLPEGATTQLLPLWESYQNDSSKVRVTGILLFNDWMIKYVLFFMPSFQIVVEGPWTPLWVCSIWILLNVSFYVNDQRLVQKRLYWTVYFHFWRSLGSFPAFTHSKVETLPWSWFSTWYASAFYEDCHFPRIKNIVFRKNKLWCCSARALLFFWCLQCLGFVFGGLRGSVNIGSWSLGVALDGAFILLLMSCLWFNSSVDCSFLMVCQTSLWGSLYL